MGRGFEDIFRDKREWGGVKDFGLAIKYENTVYILLVMMLNAPMKPRRQETGEIHVHSRGLDALRHDSKMSAACASDAR